MPSAGRATSKSIFTCPECPQTYSRKEYVERHRRLKHLGARPFGCDACDKAFARSDLLRRHKKTCMKGSNMGHQARGAVMDLPTVSPKDFNTIRPTDLLAAEEPFDPAYSFDAVVSTSASTVSSTLSSILNLHDYPFRPAPTSSSSLSPLSGVPSLSPSSQGSSSSNVTSPQTPFREDILQPPLSSSTLGGVESTLAPIFPGNFYPGYTPEEIEATRGLEDLLRSPPQKSRSINIATTEASAAIAFNSISPLSESSPWHGALSQVNSGNTNVSVLSSSWDSFPPSNDLESSPEAIALADYFNKGGVGGITALDLGFYSEPSLLPDHLFEPQLILSDEDRKFFLPSQKFCLGYLYPWHVPPLPALSRFASLAAKAFLPSIPIVHTPSLVMSEMPSHTAFALTVTGAQYDPEGENFSNEMLVEKRVFLVRGFNKPDSDDDTRFASLQSMLLYQLLGLFHRDEQQRQLSNTFHGALIMMLRHLALPQMIRNSHVEISPLLEGEALASAWKEWIKIETRRRVTFIVLLADLTIATQYSTAPLLPFSEIDLDLPASDDLWNAKSAFDWLLLITSPSSSPSIPFLSSVRALLTLPFPSPMSSAGLILSALPTLSSFPLLILSRTLSFLEMKTVEAITQIDPFREMLGGLGIFESREEEHRILLEKILGGRERLRRMPGGVKRGGGEGWYEGVIPKSFSEGAGFGSSNGGTRCSTPDAKHISKAKKVVEQEFPEFMNLSETE